ncbi:HAD family hydrolase [Methanosarcina sp. 2.H.A.1B.4]|uniref:HAD family hydrolase n=1 Tax=Methanosarcina sp. 2.H.A.1B.4 TaxID=1483600 RepID=UPI000621484B|nr:HAD family hydrolase [Methanosarcina sp. 2.H.A.1B.4]KKG10364.1 HAD family hydrolase [Methanosarcina sp. 2.H.A.1B.4]
MLQNGKIKGIIFDCYKTLIDIKTDEKSRETNERVSHWLLYQGVKIEPDRLREEYRWKVVSRLENSGQQYPDIRIEEIFAELCAENAFREIDSYWLGIETAKVFRTASIRKLEAYPQSLRLLEKYRNIPKGIVSNAQRVFTEQELRFLGLYDRFNFVIMSSDHCIKKPDTRLFKMALDRLGLEPWEVLSIGDTPENDIYAPQSLGMNAMHIHSAWKYA